MGKLSKNIVPSSIFIACTVKILYPLLLTQLFLWDCNQSSSQLKNHQAVRRTLEGQTEWLTSGSVHRASPTAVHQRTTVWAVGPAPLTGELPFTGAWGAAAMPVPGRASPGPWVEVLASPYLPHHWDLPSVAGLGSRCRAGCLASCGAWHSIAQGQPPHCALTAIHWHISYLVLTT